MRWLALLVPLLLALVRPARAEVHDELEPLVPEGEATEQLPLLNSLWISRDTGMVFSPDGRHLAFGSSDATLSRVLLFDVESGAIERIFEAAVLDAANAVDDKWPPKVRQVAFSPDGRRLAAGTEAGVILSWPLTVGASQRTEASRQFGDLAFSPDSRALRWSAGGQLVHWDLETSGTSKTPLLSAEDQMWARSVSISPDGCCVAASGSPAGKPLTRVWRLDGTGPVQELPIQRIASLMLGPGGLRLFVRGSEGIWDVPSGRRIRESPCLDPIPSLDGRTVACAGPGQIDVWDVEAGWRLRRLTSPEAGREVNLSPDGRTLAWGVSKSQVQLWDLTSGRPLRSLPGSSVNVRGLVFSPDGRYLASAASDSLVRVWDLREGQLRRIIDAPFRYWRGALAFGEDGALAVVGRSGIELHDLARGTRRSLGAGASALGSLRFSPNGSLLVAAAADLGVLLWDVKAGEPRKETPQHEGQVRAATFSPDGRLIASGHKTILLWRPEDGAVVRRLAGHTVVVEDLRFSPDGRLLISSDGGKNGTTRIWEVASGRQLRKLAGSGPLAVTPDGRRLVQGVGRVLRAFDLPGGAGPHLLKEDCCHITDLAMSPDGQRFASGHYNQQIRLWRPTDWVNDGLLVFEPHGWATQVDGRVRRHDDGDLLLRMEDGMPVPAPPPRPAQEPRLTIAATLRAPLGEGPDALGQVQLRVRNEGPGPAYWVRVRGSQLPPGLAVLPPRVYPRLDSGQEVELTVGLAYLGPLRPGAAAAVDLRLRLSHAHDDALAPIALRVSLRAPRLRLSRASVSPDEGRSDIVQLELQNDGDQGTAGLEACAGDGAAHPTGRTCAERLRQPLQVSVVFRRHGVEAAALPQPLAPLLPGASGRAAFSVPAALYTDAARAAGWPGRAWERLTGRRPFTIEVQVRGPLWPTHLWSFAPPPLALGSLARLYLLVAAGVFLLAGCGYRYLRVYRDPVVLAVARSAAVLRGFALRELPRVSGVLGRAGHLGSALGAAGIPEERWRRAVAASGPAQDAVAALCAALGVEAGARLPGAPVWRVRLPPLGLRFGPEIALAVIEGPTLEEGAAARLSALIYEEGSGPRVALALDRTAGQAAAQRLRETAGVAFVVLDEIALRDLLLGGSPAEALEAQVAAQRPLLELSPYQTGGGVSDARLFFGREAELRMIADQRLRNVLLVGPRQMGKTSLLKALERRLSTRADVEVRRFTMYTGDLARTLARHLGAAAPADAEGFVALAAGTRERPRIWLIDEADTFVKADLDAGHALSRAMRALAEDGRAYFVLTGFWQLYSAALRPSHPLRNFGEVLRLGPLDERSARELVETPMAALRLRFAAPATISCLLAETGRRANLVTLCCTGLIETLDARAHELTDEHLAAVLRGYKPLQDELGYWGHHGALDRAVVRTALMLGTPTRAEVRQRLAAVGLTLSGEALAASLDRLDLSYVLCVTPEGRLHCPVPLLRRFIAGGQDLQQGLSEDLSDCLVGQDKADPSPEIPEIIDTSSGS